VARQGGSFVDMNGKMERWEDGWENIIGIYHRNISWEYIIGIYRNIS